MDQKKSYIPIKVFLGYLLLVLLFGSVGWFLYSENKSFTRPEKSISDKNDAVLKVSTVLSDLYKTESLARIAIQSDSETDFKQYVAKTRTLTIAIDSLKTAVSTPDQVQLLNSVQILLSKKTQNILQLKAIKNKTEDETAVSSAITDLTKMESSMRKLQLEDFVKNPAEMADYQRNVLKKYVAYLNQNIPDDSSNTLSKKESDSIISTSKMLLNQVKTETANKKNLLILEENKLLQNGLSISEQLRKVLETIEREIIANTAKNFTEREKSLQKTNQIVTSAAIIGLVLTLLFLILILNDFSKTQSYKKQLETANLKAKKLLTSREQLISTVSHDLKTPLSTIVGYTELLGNSDLSSKQLHFTKNIKGSSDYISKLVQDLLDFTQIEAGKITIEKISFSLPESIKEISTSIQAVYAHKTIELLLDIDSDLEQRIIGDPFRLRQIISNIVGNAFKFTEKGFIKITAKANRKSKIITILIEDSGIGIAAKNQELIFEEFTQADDQIEKKYGGTGLGLTISKKMASILGGDLNLKSELGKGSIFEIQIPLQYDTTTLDHLSAPANELQSKRIAVLIDDDHNLLQLTTEVLQQHDFIVYPFGKATETLNWIENHAFDLIITDIQMPVMDGFLFIKELQNAQKTNYDKQPIIAVTGRNDLSLADYTEAGFITVVRKPYSPKILLNTIHAIYNNSEIPNQKVKNKKTKTPEKLYSLKELKAFLPDDTQGLSDILQSFMSGTLEAMTLLEQAVLTNNRLDINEIAHKMNPMFKQIKAVHISTILDQLENKDTSSEEFHALLLDLKDKIPVLFALLNKELH
ncbi:Sensor histidine kinase RcsC [Flavobacterium sp. CECT 9288]|uniref:hybrid sensor histidine kinase/response regulator n=1 Tax=Flavobacterium sp. CECT 9288 TaxID=2845819 RepID=UPI001E32EA44|nr:ATP-binding protein [Flavobacterium sp. CECT 9288]CAH0337166.1 Sensor histidine kinase RcsC [Flavobacterium sp. CECT 9288]